MTALALVVLMAALAAMAFMLGRLAGRRDVALEVGAVLEALPDVVEPRQAASVMAGALLAIDGIGRKHLKPSPRQEM